MSHRPAKETRRGGGGGRKKKKITSHPPASLGKKKTNRREGGEFVFCERRLLFVSFSYPFQAGGPGGDEGRF